MRNDITGLGLTPEGGTVKIGAAVQLNLFARTKRGGTDLVPANVATWMSADARVGEVNRQGRFTARRPGLLTITVSYAGLSAQATFTVEA